MARTTWLVLLAAGLPAAAACALQPASSPAPQATPTTVPDSDVESADLVKDAISWDDLEEQVRFAVACGEKRELSESAFEENRKHHNRFVRRFDRWDQIVLFDRNGNGAISWAEASLYRAALRRALLAAYDADRDGLLAGDERAAANKALAEGKLPPLKTPKPVRAPQPPATPGPSTATRPSPADANAHTGNMTRPGGAHQE